MRILIADDSKAMRMIIRRNLRQAGFGSHDVEEAVNGKEALTAIENNPPDLVLTDWNMPEMTGIELVEAVSQREMGVKIGLITSQATPEMQAQAKDAGALFLITKPFTAATFEDVLTPVLG